MTLSRGRAMLLRAATEDDFGHWVKTQARLHGWNGLHIRWSMGVLEAVHTLHRDGWSEAFGLPDWYFWSPARHQHFWAELKSWSGQLRPSQRQCIDTLRACGETVFVWWPRDEEQVEQIFREGPGGLGSG